MYSPDNRTKYFLAAEVAVCYLSGIVGEVIEVVVVMWQDVSNLLIGLSHHHFLAPYSHPSCPPSSLAVT